jgi:hypothetical protein
MSDRTEASAAALSDAYPVLLGPVRLEYRFTATELLVRVFPDEWAVDAFEERCTRREHDHVRRYWRRRWEAGGEPDGQQTAWRDLVSHVGAGRAAHLVRTRRPRNPQDEPRRAQPGQRIVVLDGDEPADGAPPGSARADEARTEGGPGVVRVVLDLPTPTADDTRDSSWTEPARARLLPDAFTLLGYVDGQLVLDVTGNPVPAELTVGPDPSTPEDDQFASSGTTLHVPETLAWLTDFDAAVSVGMAFRIPLTDAIRGGLHRLVALGLRVRDPATSRTDLERHLTHQAGSRAGLRLLAQGTPTNNTGRTPSALGTGDEAAEIYAALQAGAAAPQAGAAAPPGATLDAWAAKTDGQWLAELVGIDPAVLAPVPGADGSDQAEARAMNVALWPATWGYHLGTMFNPILGTDALDRTRDFFTRYVSGRGPIPAVRIGRQPYGILVTTAFSRLAWPDGDPDTAHRRALNSVLAEATQDWTTLAEKVPFLGADGDPHALLLGILGLHPTSAEFHQRYAQSVEDYFNRSNLNGHGGEVLEALDHLGARPGLRALLTRFGYPVSAPDPDAAARLFVGRQHPLGGPLIDDRPLSETDRVRSWTADGQSYLGWLASKAASAFDVVRVESGFRDDHPPTAVLYLLLRHAVLNSYAEAALRLAASAHAMSEAEVVRARREPAFIHISTRVQASESRFARLYAPDPAVTGDPLLLVADHVTRIIGQQPATRELADQLAAITTLDGAPTARLERALVEHLDCCSYRLDAWRTGLAAERLFALRYPTPTAPAVTGVHLGAFGWLEEVRPRPTPQTPVTLAGELAAVFTPPGAGPLVSDPGNQGYVHAPSPSHATTAALLRTGYLADASPDNPGTLAVNLSSARVRTALSFLDGIRAGQSLGALLGYRLERGLHDGHAIAETDRFLSALRLAFPLVAARLPAEPPPAGTPIESLEARNVVDGLALVRHVTRTGPATYPFGRTDLPAADAGQAAAIDAEVQALVEIQDALADLAVAEGVHQSVLGNHDRSAAGMDAFTRTGSPPDPEVVRTPTSGRRLDHRFALHLQAGRSPEDSPLHHLEVTPRAGADPAVNAWLADLLPDPDDVACTVGWADPARGDIHERVVTQAELGLQPIDLLWALRPEDQAAMSELDDRVVARVHHEEELRADTELLIRYVDRVPDKVSLFELSPLVAALRTTLLAARPARPGDYAAPADGSVLDPHLDDDVDLPRERPQFVRDTLHSLAHAVRDARDELTELLADPVDRRGDILEGADDLLHRYGDLVLTAGGFGIVRSGWGELLAWRRDRFRDVLAAVRTAADRMTGLLRAADEQLDAEASLPDDATDEQRFALLQQAERLLTTNPTSPRPDTPRRLRRTVRRRREEFGERLDRLSQLAGTTRSHLGGLLDDVRELLPLAPFDPVGLDLTPFEDAVVAFCADVLSRLTNLYDEIVQRIPAVDRRLEDYDAATGGPERVAAATAAVRAGLGPDALATSEFGLSHDVGHAVQRVVSASADGRLTRHLDRDFPVDDWLHGLARVRACLARWERISLLAEAVGKGEPELLPIQLPYQDDDPWLALELPDGWTLTGDRLLLTAHYAHPFDHHERQCALLIDEWTETIPGPTAATAIAAHYDRPGTQPPQSLLLVVPPARAGSWRWADLAGAVGETLDLARTRAVEPGQIDRTAYAQALPATVLAAAARPITIGTDLSINNEVPQDGTPFRPARG